MRTGSFTAVTFTSVNDVGVARLGFDGNYPTNTGSGNAIRFATVTRGFVEQCQFTNTPDTAVSLNVVDTVWVSDNYFNNTRHSAVRVENPLTNANRRIWIDRNRMIASQVAAVDGNGAIQVHGANTQEYIWIRGNYIETAKVCIGCDGQVHLWVIGNYCSDANGGEGIAFTGSDILVQGNECSNGDTAAGILWWCKAGNARVKIVDNTASNYAQGVALVWVDEGASFEDCIVARNKLFSNSFGIQTYKNGSLTTYTYDNCELSFNDMADNTSANNILAPSSGNSARQVLNRTNASDSLELGGANFKMSSLVVSNTATVGGRNVSGAPYVISLNTGPTTNTDAPLAVQEFNNTVGRRIKLDLTGVTQFRITAKVNTAGVSGHKLATQYSTDESTWKYMGSDTATGSAPSAGDYVTVDTTGTKTSSFTNLTANAKADVFVRLVSLDGDGVADPVFGMVTLQVK
jgi:hypothetical protein